MLVYQKVSPVYASYNYSFHGVYKPTNITGGHHPVVSIVQCPFFLVSQAMPNVQRVGWKTSRAIGLIAPRRAAETIEAIVHGVIKRRGQPFPPVQMVYPLVI